MDKAATFKNLHHNGKLLVLPNVWDPLGALLLESLGYKAIATASASIAYSNGYHDGEQIPLKQVIFVLEKIVDSVDIPVSADIESGYAKSNSDLEENIKRLIDTGIAGINFEDSRHDGVGLIPEKEQCRKIALIRKIADQNNSKLFINARTDVFLKGENLSEEEKIKEAIRRGNAYKNAGADGFYPIIIKSQAIIERLINEVQLPTNILLLPGIPGFEELQKIKLARLSLGPGFLKIALNAMKNIGEKLLNYKGMEEVQNNAVTGNYPDSLIKSLR